MRCSYSQSMMTEVTQPVLAGRVRRATATLIDAILVPALTIFLVMITDVAEDAEDYIDNTWVLWVLVLAIVSYLLLNGVSLYRNGQTLGKKAVGIQIAMSGDFDGGQTRLAPLWRLVCVRAVFFPLMYLIVVPWLLLLPLLDHLMIFGKSRRCLHDWAAGTVVVLKNR